jgi:hypothetical protein
MGVGTPKKRVPKWSLLGTLSKTLKNALLGAVHHVSVLIQESPITCRRVWKAMIKGYSVVVPCRALTSAESSRVRQSLGSCYVLITELYAYFKIKYL